ncbi:DNA damage response protein RcaA [Taphrina deformans PYCC 5710]|uniref:DNA damage response protein RcaA n=1 Tax=Taphrina deformans (strain PYCC 5710 / ATCC 11124 / CBS 356.35 / IMI 108563 / JCM 9778 / NBRC 8474) TaxID=1097556 RepID=R4X728_TAPDE|nr:DNA damage response protein RcaA [Taphrina deformans PYCC 5710]|eukprot:CCG81067.1 DNA damage response protein RcaA [Taphrina deformans PYCC 5710]
MWVVQIPEASNHNLQFKEKWIKPGTAFTIGRESNNTVTVEGAKSVSKAHVRITVIAAPSEQVNRPSQLTIQDLKSKFSTFLTYSDKPDEIVLNDSASTETSDVSIRLGKAQDVVFRIFWKPVVLTLSNIKPVEVLSYCAILDIRYSKDYSAATTHVVTDKYNTPKSLTGLAHERWIVAKAYVEEMSRIASSLECDMLAMPDPKKIDLLPMDEFSGEYGHEVFFPKKERRTAFKNLQFVFFSSKQHKNLTMPICAGAGTSLLVLLSNGTHEVFESRKTLPLDIEMISMLKETDSLVAEGDIASSATISTGTEPALKTDVANKDEEEKPITKRIGSRGYVPLTTFEDDLFGGVPDVTSSQRTSAPSLARSPSRKSIVRPVIDPIDLFDDDEYQSIAFKSQKTDSQYQPLTKSSQVQQNSSPGIDSGISDASHPMQQQVQKSMRTRRSQQRQPVEYIEDFEPAPAAAALEKLRSQIQGSVEVPTQRAKLPASSPAEKATTKPSRPFDMIEEEIQQALTVNKRKATHGTPQSDNEDNGEDNTQLKNLGTVEFFELELKDNSGKVSAAQIHGARELEPRWAGRKNFKRFRRAREGVPSESGAERPAIMIRLVESTPTDRSLADKTWLETATTRHRDSGRTGHTKSSSATGSNRLSQPNRYSSQTQRSTQTVMNETQAAQEDAQRSLFMPDDSDSDDDPLKFRL